MCEFAALHFFWPKSNVSNARLVLVILICGCPFLLIFAGPLALGFVTGVTAIGMAIVSWTMRPGERTFFLSVARPAAILTVIPALWIFIQVLPIKGLSHPIWASVEAANGHPVTGSISINPGASRMAFGEYLTIVAIGFWSAAVAVHRRRAEWILFSLMAGTALISVLAVGNEIFGLSRLSTEISPPAQVQAIETLVALRSDLIATGYGMATFAAVVLIRRLGFGRWGAGGIALPAVVLAAFLAASNSELRTKSFALAFAESPSSLTSMSQRILDDSPSMGIGAGTFASIAPIYRDIDQRELPPTTAATASIEFGRPVSGILVLIAIGASVVLFRAALQRGRESFYPAMGAGCLITLLFLCFINSGLLGMASAIIAPATLGLAFARSKSRTV